MVNEICSSFRHMPKTVEESLLGDHSDQWLDTDCPEAKRLKVSCFLTLWHTQITVTWIFKKLYLKIIRYLKPVLNSRVCVRSRWRSRVFSQTARTLWTAGSGRSTTWQPQTSACLRPWPSRLHRVNLMVTAWTSMSGDQVWQQCTVHLQITFYWWFKQHSVLKGVN